MSLSRRESLDAVAGQVFHLVIASAILSTFLTPAPINESLRLLRTGGFLRPNSHHGADRQGLPSLGNPVRLHIPSPVPTLVRFLAQNLELSPLEGIRMEVLSSRPSLVENSFRIDPVRTLGAYLLNPRGTS